MTLLGRLRDATGDAVTTFELIPRVALAMVLAGIERTTDPFAEAHDWYALVEVTTSRADPHLRDVLEGTLGAALEEGLVRDAVFATSGPQRDAFWRLRESIPEAQSRVGASSSTTCR